MDWRLEKYFSKKD